MALSRVSDGQTKETDVGFAGDVPTLEAVASGLAEVPDEPAGDRLARDDADHERTLAHLRELLGTRSPADR